MKPYRYTVSTENGDRDSRGSYATPTAALFAGREAARKGNRQVTLTVWGPAGPVLAKEVIEPIEPIAPTVRHLNDDQRRALKMMDDRNLGAVYVNGGWVFRQTVREHPGVALQVRAELETQEMIARYYDSKERNR